MTESPLSLAAVGGLLSGITTAVFDALDDMLTTLFPASYGEIAAAERHRKSLQPFETEFEQALNDYEADNETLPGQTSATPRAEETPGPASGVDAGPVLHPTPWRTATVVSEHSIYLVDANGSFFAWIDDRETAELIVDIANSR